MPKELMPVRVRGVTYHSAQACADAIGVTRKAVYAALARGTPDRIGLKCAAGKPKPFTYRMLSWPSKSAASIELGLERGHVCKCTTGSRRLQLLHEQLDAYILRELGEAPLA
jgi:hypothetical protein